MTITLHNPGILDITALTTVGVSVKEKDNAIGRFGTGAKYAFAYLLRTGHTITIYSGGLMFNVTTKPHEIRGQTFEIVYINDEKAGFSTEMGVDWKGWQAYRELYSNALDEGGDVMYGEPDRIDPTHTYIVVTGEEFDKIYKKRDDFFIAPNRLPIAIVGQVEIYKAKEPESHLFYQGIRCSERPHVSRYTYNMLSSVQLSEQRHTDPMVFMREVWANVIQARNECPRDVARALASVDEDHIEAKAPFTPWAMEGDFLSHVMDLEDMIKNRTLYRLVKDARNEDRMAGSRVANAKEAIAINEAKDYLELVGFPVTHDIFIKDPPEDMDVNWWALASMEENRIYLNSRLFFEGKRMMVKALYEERLHLVHKVDDYTREFQNIVINDLVNSWQDITGVSL